MSDLKWVRFSDAERPGATVYAAVDELTACRYTVAENQPGVWGWTLMDEDGSVVDFETGHATSDAAMRSADKNADV